MPGPPCQPGYGAMMMRWFSAAGRRHGDCASKTSVPESGLDAALVPKQFGKAHDINDDDHAKRHQNQQNDICQLVLAHFHQKSPCQGYVFFGLKGSRRITAAGPGRAGPQITWNERPTRSGRAFHPNHRLLTFRIIRRQACANLPRVVNRNCRGHREKRGPARRAILLSGKNPVFGVPPVPPGGVTRRRGIRYPPA